MSVPNNKKETLSFTLSHYAIEVLIRESSKRGVDMASVIETWAANEELNYKKGKKHVNSKIPNQRAV